MHKRQIKKAIKELEREINGSSFLQLPQLELRLTNLTSMTMAKRMYWNRMKCLKLKLKIVQKYNRYHHPKKLVYGKNNYKNVPLVFNASIIETR